MDLSDIQTLTPAHLNDIATVHCAAFPDSALTQLGPPVVRRYYRSQFTGPHNMIALGVFVNNQLAGYCLCGSFRGATGNFVMDNKAFLVGCVLRHPRLLASPLVRNRIRISLRIFLVYFKRRWAAKTRRASVSSVRGITPHFIPYFSILAIATLPEYQGHGIGKMLIQSAEEIARARGFQDIHLYVHPENKGGIQFYEKLNWEKVEENGAWRGRLMKTLCP